MGSTLEAMADSSQHWRITFWPVQLTAWSAFGAVSILGTLVRPDRTRIDAHYTSITVSGFLATLLLRVVYRRLLRDHFSGVRLACWRPQTLISSSYSPTARVRRIEIGFAMRYWPWRWRMAFDRQRIARGVGWKGSLSGPRATQCRALSVPGATCFRETLVER